MGTVLAERRQLYAAPFRHEWHPALPFSRTHARGPSPMDGITSTRHCHAALRLFRHALCGADALPDFVSGISCTIHSRESQPGSPLIPAG